MLGTFLKSLYSGPFLTIKPGKFGFVWPKCRLQIGLMPFFVFFASWTSTENSGQLFCVIWGNFTSLFWAK